MDHDMADKPSFGGGRLKRPPRLGEEVYHAIYARLMSLEIPPGGRISVDSLVRELGVSQTPIREALSRLEAQGLVEKQHLIGYSATSQMDRDRLEQLYELRLLLEPFAARRAARIMSEEATDRLFAIDRDMRTVHDDDPRRAYGAFARLDGAFHDQIAIGSGNMLVYETLSHLHVHTHLFRLLFHARATLDANAEHERLLAAIRTRDEEAAEAAMRDHIEASKLRFMSIFGG